MSRKARSAAACLAIAALLFAPFVTTAHACPFMGDGAAMHAMGDTGVPHEAPPCANHCDEGPASVDQAKTTPAPAAIPVPVLRVIAPEPPAARRALAHSGDFLADPSPPLTRYTVLRI